MSMRTGWYLCVINFITLLRDIKANLDKWKYKPCSYMETQYCRAIDYLIYKCDIIPIKSPMHYFLEHSEII